jgi:L-threonylcarbamoyladenylate synthase
MALSGAALDADGARALERCVRSGGVAVFPADTVYGLACDPESEAAVRRLYELKGRDAGKPAAVMWFDRERALAALPDLGPRTEVALRRLLPGGVTLLVPNPRGRFPLAGRGGAALGVRVPALAGPLAVLAGIGVAVLQSSANAAGGPDARRVADVPESIRAGADLVLDAGELPGTPSTVVDLSAYETDGSWRVLREGAVPRATLEAAL